MIPIDINLLKIKEAREFHINLLFPEVKKKLKDVDDEKMNNFLNDGKIKHVLGGNPKELNDVNNDFFSSVIQDFKIEELKQFNSISKNKKFENYSNIEKELYEKFLPVFKKVQKIFNYKSLSSIEIKDVDYLYFLAKKLDIPTCVYCNRMYTKSVIRENLEEDQDEKLKKSITRPTFDHWFPKSKYPLLAISFYNLIPSCTICNSTIKGYKDVSLEKEFHPYYTHIDSSKKLEYSFNFDHKDYSNFKFKINTSNIFSEDSVKAYALEEIYKAHEDEIKDLRRIKDAYTESYLKSIEENILKQNISREEIYRFAFGTHFEDAYHDKRPLSKMKKDILIELGIIKN